MAVLKAVIIVPTAGGEPGDIVVNNWHFRSPDVSPTTLGQIEAAVKAFYVYIQQLYPTGVRLDQMGVQWYDMLQTPPRVPIREASITGIAQGSGTAGPSEVALCLSFYATRIAGLNPARSRGRVYLGPFDYVQLNGPSPSTTMVTMIASAAQALLDASTTSQWDWIVWSQTQHDSPQGTNFADQTVVGGYVDNAWDTQRRRGIAGTTRTPFGAASRSVSSLGV